MDMTLCAGMTLYTRNGDKLQITAVSDKSLTVTFGQKHYSKSKDDIGNTLFLSNPLEDATAKDYKGDAVFEQESVHLRETQALLETFSGFLLKINVGDSGFVVGTETGFDEVTKESLIANPYFARMDIEINDQTGRSTEVAYIGKKGVYHENHLVVSDWRSEIGQKYYMKNITKFTNNAFDYELLLRRLFRIHNRVLTRYENEYAKSAYLKTLTHVEIPEDIRSEKITDPFLQDIIRQKHYQNKLTDIIESIQENQNAIITSGENDSIVVQGCAGSGKTMILLHRLSFIKYQNRNLDFGKIKILTPNSLFSMYLNDLSTSLELEKIDRLTVSEYYAELLTRYYDIERSQLAQRCTPVELKDFREILLSGEKAAKGWPMIYSESLRAYIEQDTVTKLRKFFDHSIKIEQISTLLQDKLNDRTGGNYDIRTVAVLRSILQRVIETFGPYDKQLQVYMASEEELRSAEQKFLRVKTTLPNADALLNGVFGELMQKAPKLREKYEQRRNGLLKQKKAGKAISNIELLESEFCLRAVILEKAKHVFEVDKKLLRQEKARIPYTEEEMELIQSALAQVGGFSVSLIEKSVISRIERDRGVSLSYKNRLYVRLLINFVIFGKLPNPDRMLCVDEGHDLYVNEYRLFSLVNGGAMHFNIYGDVNQLINEGEGISDWDTLKSAFSFALFSLNENYRNSSEIIKYSNDTLGFSTTNLGISGEPVRILGFADFLTHINSNIIGTRKLAVIVKKKTPSLVKRLCDGIGEQLNLSEINSGEISLLTPVEAKGLEFDTCYVMTEGMNKNEKYISFTRALNELYIVSN